MKILHLINSLAAGGAEKLLIETIPLFVEKGIAIDVLLLDGSDSPFLSQLKELKCCGIYSLGKRSVYNPLHLFKIIPYLNKYDLIHVHLFPAQYWVVFAKILSLSKVKLVFTEHSTSNRRIQNQWFKYIERFVYSFYSRIICITEDVKNVFLAHTKLNEQKFVVIANGVNLNEINKAEVSPKDKIEEHSINKKDKLIIQVAGFRIEKDQKTSIRALHYLESDIKLILVGDGLLRKECEVLVKELNLEERVFFLGVRTDVLNLLKTADISVVSSNWEGFGLAAVEGMAVGKPVIASNVSGLSSVVKGGGLLFEKGNERELAALITKLLSDENYYNQVAATCFERAQLFDIKHTIDKLIQLYKVYE